MTPSAMVDFLCADDLFDTFAAENEKKNAEKLAEQSAAAEQSAKGLAEQSAE